MKPANLFQSVKCSECEWVGQVLQCQVLYFEVGNTIIAEVVCPECQKSIQVLNLRIRELAVIEGEKDCLHFINTGEIRKNDDRGQNTKDKMESSSGKDNTQD